MLQYLFLPSALLSPLLELKHWKNQEAVTCSDYLGLNARISLFFFSLMCTGLCISWPCCFLYKSYRKSHNQYELLGHIE